MNKFSVLFFMLISNFVFSQNLSNVIDSTLISTKYFHDFQQEKMYLHTNKTTYFTEEKIWWKAYVVDDSNDKLVLTTTNLYVNFYDLNKDLVSSQLFDCIEGKANGEINLPSNLKTGTYYIQLDTQWNRNFKNNYVSTVEIVNTKVKESLDKVVVLEDSDKSHKTFETLDVSFFPESGTLLKNSANVVYFTIKSEGRYVANQDVELQDKASGKTISNFKTDPFGMGMFRIYYLPDHDYILKFNNKGKAYSFDLKGAKDSGIIINKIEDSALAENANFKIILSKDLSEAYDKQNLFVTIHRNHKLLYILPLKINKANTKYVLPVAKENLFNGVNTLTLFSPKNEPIAERHFFIETKNQIKIDITQKEVIGDSLKLNLKILNTNRNTNLSISVLPKETKLNDAAVSIVNGFLLNPYVEEQFPSIDNVSKENLDMFLQLHKSMTKTYNLNNDKPIFKVENGLQLKGSVNAEIQNDYKVMLSSTVNGILEVTSVNPDKSFQFDNLILKDSSDYRLSLINKKGELLKAVFYVYSLKGQYKPDSFLKDVNPIIKIAKELDVASQIDNDIAYKESEILETVILQGKKEKTEKRKPKVIGGASSKTLEITDSEASRYTLLQYLRVRPELFVSDFIAEPKVGFKRKGGEALILLDGALAYAGLLSNIQLSEVEAVRLNVNGYGFGSRGINGVIYIDLKKWDSGSGYRSQTYFEGSVDFGFSETSTVFDKATFEFNTFESSSFYEFLDWIPNFIVFPNQLNTLDVYKGNHKNIKLYINGMNDNGELFSDVVEIPVRTEL